MGSGFGGFRGFPGLSVLKFRFGGVIGGLSALKRGSGSSNALLISRNGSEELAGF